MINNSLTKRECRPEEVAKFVLNLSSDKSKKQMVEFLGLMEVLSEQDLNEQKNYKKFQII